MNKKQLPNYSLYAVIDRESCFKNISETVKGCVKAGVEIIQLRDKAQNADIFHKNALLSRKITAGKALFIINDRADIARVCEADGLHLGQFDIPISAARKILGEGKIIGKSCHSLKQALSAEKEGADYISIGPIFKTPTKPKAKAVGLKLLGIVRKRVRIPTVAIGGIDKKNAYLLRASKAKIIAVVRAVCKTRGLSKAVSELRKAAFSANKNDSIRISFK